jgi:hypothetical protein
VAPCVGFDVSKVDLFLPTLASFGTAVSETQFGKGEVA